MTSDLDRRLPTKLTYFSYLPRDVLIEIWRLSRFYEVCRPEKVVCPTHPFYSVLIESIHTLCIGREFRCSQEAGSVTLNTDCSAHDAEQLFRNLSGAFNVLFIHYSPEKSANRCTPTFLQASRNVNHLAFSWKEASTKALADKQAGSRGFFKIFEPVLIHSGKNINILELDINQSIDAEEKVMYCVSKYCPSIRSLKLRTGHLNFKESQPYWDSVAPRLHALDLSESYGISDQSMSRLLTLLRKKSPNLSMLRLANESVAVPIANLIMLLFAKQGLKLTHGSLLNLSSTYCERILAACPNLSNVDLLCNEEDEFSSLEILAHRVKQLSLHVSEHSNIEKLRLGMEKCICVERLDLKCSHSGARMYPELANAVFHNYMSRLRTVRVVMRTGRPRRLAKFEQIDADFTARLASCLHSALALEDVHICGSFEEKSVANFKPELHRAYEGLICRGVEVRLFYYSIIWRQVHTVR